MHFLQSAPGDDVEILNIRVVQKEDEKVLLVSYNIPATRDLSEGFMERLPVISNHVEGFAEKYGITDALKRLFNILNEVENFLGDARFSDVWHSQEISELSKLFRNVVVSSQKTIQVLLNAAINFLRETKYNLPGMDEATLAEIFSKIRFMIAEMLEKLANNLEIYFSPILENFSTVEITFPFGKVMTVAEVQENVRSTLRSNLAMIVNVMKQTKGLDVFLERLGQTLREVVDKAQEFVDSIKSNILEFVAAPLNTFYKKLLQTFDELSTTFIFLVLFPLSELYSKILTNWEEFVNANNGIQQIELPLPFFQ